VVEEAFLEEEDITHHLGDWYAEGGHHQTEVYLKQEEEHYTAPRKANGRDTR
jgi:hypothetical protein